MRRRVSRGARPSAAPGVRPPHRRAVREGQDRAQNALRVIDISRPIGEETEPWEGDVPFSWRATARLVEGSLFESTCFTMSSHLGTHVDAPSHVLPAGRAIGDVSLNAFLGPARVVDLPGRGEIGPDALPPRSVGVRRVLFRTRGRAFLAPLAAVRLAERGTILVGTDARSIDPDDAEDLPVHRTLLSRGVMVLENLNLEGVEPGDYGLVALPLAFRELDASPVRAILIKTE
ncbi:MAG TPA: cyclase family protein [Thermoanaerobaculia bacterium]|nr:cyclase family protein [Thermoanaerobaculia bacterium]